MNTLSHGDFGESLTRNDYRLRYIGSQDVDEHAHNLSLWEQKYDQLAPGRFAGSLSEFWTAEAQVFLEHTSHAVRQACRVWDDAIWFGVPTRHDGTRIDGREAPEGAVLVHPGGAEFELLTPSDHEIFGVVVRREAIERFCEITGVKTGWPSLAQASWVQVDTASRRNSIAALQTLFRELSGHETAPHHAASRNTLGQTVMNLLLPFVEAPAEEPSLSGAFGRRRKVVARILEYAQEHPDWVPTVPELCERFYLSRRSLQYAFEDVLGVSPQVYLRTLRLNGVRRSLRNPGNAFMNVQEAAAAWGFWNLSQFSQDYRRLFGERPSDTLQGARATQRH